MDARREHGLALGGLLGGGALALVVAQASWVVARTRELGYGTAFRGADVAPALVACSLVAMAGSVAVLATRGLARRVVGVVLALVGAALTTAAVRVLLDPGSAVRDPLRAATGGASAAAPVVVSVDWWWPLLAAFGGLAVAVAGAAAVVRSTRWPGMAARYDSPTAGRQAKQPDAWTLIDRGDDPTLDPPDGEPTVPGASPPAASDHDLQQ